MSENFFGAFEKHMLDYVESMDSDTPIQRTSELIRVEKELHQGFDSWTDAHTRDYKSIRKFPYLPRIFSDQRLDRPSRPINAVARFIKNHEETDNKIVRPAIYLGRVAYFNTLKKAHAATVGSSVLADTMILAFLETPAHDDFSAHPSLAEYAIDSLNSKEDRTIGLAAGHLDRLSDVGELAGALNIAMAELSGSFKYIDRVNTLVNMNMTRETLYHVYMPWLLTVGTGVRWGVPIGESARAHGISDELAGIPNALCAKTFVTDKRMQSEVLAYVPAGSGAEKTYDPTTNELMGLRLKNGAYTAPFAVRCLGGIICGNRFGNEIALSPVIDTTKPDDIKPKDHERNLTDKVMSQLAYQAHDLSRVPVEYTQLNPTETILSTR